MIRRVEAHDIPLHLNHVRAFAVLGDEWWTEAELIADLNAGRRALFLIGNKAAALVRVCGDALFIDGLVGTGFNRWGADFDAAMRAEAKRLGLSEVAARCRRGFAPFARRMGWRETHREYRVRAG